MSKLNSATWLLATLTAATLLVGCGASTPVATPKRQVQRAPLQAPLTGLAPQAGAAGAPDAQAGQVLALVRQAQQTTAGFTATVDTYEKGPKGDSESQTLKVAYKKPGTLMVHIAKATSDSKDAKVLWDGSGEMKVKPAWLPLKVTVGLTDARVVSRNGWTIKETDVSCILNVVLDPAAQIKFLGDQVVDGKNVALMEVKSTKSPKGVTHELIGIDRQLNLPAVRLVYKGQTLAYKLIVRQMKLGAPSAAALEI